MIITAYLLLMLVALQCRGEWHTQYFKQHNLDNNNYQYYDPRTFGINLYNDPCTRITNNNVFKTYLNHKVKCEGLWCLNQQFKCEEKGSTNCYHVEHIIDLKGSDYVEKASCKTIVANLVMISGSWHKALGGLSINYYVDAQKEKRLIYGDTMVDRVKAMIDHCCGNYSSSPYDPSCDDQDSCDCDGDTVCGCDCSGLEPEPDYYLYGICTTVIVLEFIILGLLLIPMILVLIKVRTYTSI